MAIFANIRRQDVLWVLAGGNRAVMAAYAVAHDIRMIEIRRRPCDSSVAVVTIVATRDMRWMFSGRADAVMTSRAIAEYLCVIDRYHGCPDRRTMAVLANIRGLNMHRPLTGHISTIVASHAVVRDIDMVEIGGHPGDRGVAVLAAIAARNVQCMFAGRGDAVMAGTTAT